MGSCPKRHEVGLGGDEGKEMITHKVCGIVSTRSGESLDPILIGEYESPFV